jgi:hypothetical protein
VDASQLLRAKDTTPAGLEFLESAKDSASFSLGGGIEGYYKFLVSYHNKFLMSYLYKFLMLHGCKFQLPYDFKYLVLL